MPASLLFCSRFKAYIQNVTVFISYLSCDSWPDFQRVVVRAADDAIATELEAGDHVVIVAFEHL